MKTGAEYRHQGKLRMQKFREEMKKNGYSSITIFISDDFRAELDRLQNENTMNRQAALDYIFDTYQRYINNTNVNRTINCSEPEIMNNAVNTDALSELPEKKFEINGETKRVISEKEILESSVVQIPDNKISELTCQPSLDKQLEVLWVEFILSANALKKLSKHEKDEYQKRLVQTRDQLHNAGYSFAVIADAMNKLGILSVRGLTIEKSNMRKWK